MLPATGGKFRAAGGAGLGLLGRVVGMAVLAPWFALRAVGGLVGRTLPAPVRQAFQAVGAAFLQHREPDPVQLAEAFGGDFRRRFATEDRPGPAFEPTSYRSALQKARREFRFLVAYLHAAEHPASNSFCRNVLCDPAVAGALGDSFVVWGGDMRETEAFGVAQRLRVCSFPALVVLSQTGSSQTVMVCSVEGPIDAEDLVALLAEVLDEQGSALVAARAEEDSWRADRNIREEQDAAYEASLRADQEREARRLAEEEAAGEVARAEEARQAEERERAAAEVERLAALTRRREEKEGALEAEPAAGPDVASVSIRLPDGSRTVRRFARDAQVARVFDYVDTLPSLLAIKYSLVSNFPRQVYSRESHQGATVQAAGLHPQAALFVQAEDS